jgi:hypothetical protein
MIATRRNGKLKKKKKENNNKQEQRSKRAQVARHSQRGIEGIIRGEKQKREEKD